MDKKTIAIAIAAFLLGDKIRCRIVRRHVLAPNSTFNELLKKVKDDARHEGFEAGWTAAENSPSVALKHHLSYTSVSNLN